MDNKLLLLRGDAVVRELPLGRDALEIGSASTCDVVVDDPAVPPRAYLVQARGGTVWLHDLGSAAHAPSVLPLERRVPLGRYDLLRRTGPFQSGVQARLTLPVDAPREPVSRWTIVVGRGQDARRVAIADEPLSIGKLPSNDLVLHDPTVSGHHCRLEPAPGCLFVRDLGSTNGTFVQGVRVTRAQLTTGMSIRVGRTDLMLLASTVPADAPPRRIVAVSPAMQNVVAEAQCFARLPWPVLVLGPSGAGKEEIAQLVHRESARKGPFVALNAGGLPRELVESELFGHERGAFTGAVAQRRGAFEQAEGGTLFLDEIGELPLELQARLLRVLETWQIRRVGAETPVDVNVRLVCATHRDLARMVSEGSFREDLYYRLARLVVRIPSLAERPADVLPLAEHFLGLLAPEVGPRALTTQAKTRLVAHAWQGNARELRNVLGVAAALSPGEAIDAADIERALFRLHGPRLAPELEPAQLEAALAQHGGNLSALARALSVPRSTLKDRLKKASGGAEP